MHLAQNYPNPFNPRTVISYQLPVTSHIDLSIFNVLGQKMATIVDEKQPAGQYTYEFDASKFDSGIYFYRLKTNNFCETKRMLLLK